LVKPAGVNTVGRREGEGAWDAILRSKNSDQEIPPLPLLIHHLYVITRDDSDSARRGEARLAVITRAVCSVLMWSLQSLSPHQFFFLYNRMVPSDAAADTAGC